MKLFEITTIDIRSNGEYGDEFLNILTFSFKEAVEEKEKALTAYNALHPIDKKKTVIECRIYEIPDDTDITDEDAVINAKCECGGYNLF